MNELQRRKMLADSLDRLIAAHIAPDDIPGMALRICHKGETLYDRGFGFRDFEQKKPMGRIPYAGSIP